MIACCFTSTLYFTDILIDLLGTNTGEFLGGAPTGKTFRVPVVAVFSFDGDRITNERVYLDAASLLRQIGRTDLLPLAGTDFSPA